MPDATAPGSLDRSSTFLQLPHETSQPNTSLPAVDVMDERLEAELRELVQRLRTDLNQALVTVCLFGSQVDGAAPERDIDLLVIWDGAPDRRWGRGDRIRAAASAVSPRLEAWLSPIVLTPEEARDFKPYYLGILDRHRLLFDRERFFATVLDRLRRRLAEMGARRLTDPDGFVYWDLAPNWQPGDEVIL